MDMSSYLFMTFCADYYNRSFVYTQRIVSEALIRYWEPGAVGELEATSWNIQKIPYPPYINDAMVQVLQQNFPSVLMLSFILSVIVMCKNIVYEKERQLKVNLVKTLNDFTKFTACIGHSLHSESVKRWSKSKIEIMWVDDV